MTIDEGEFTNFFINNLQLGADGTVAAPFARADDGELRVVAARAGVIGSGGQAGLKAECWRKDGRHTTTKEVGIATVQTIEVRGSKGVAQVDGELVEFDGKLRVECLKRALYVVCGGVEEEERGTQDTSY